MADLKTKATRTSPATLLRSLADDQRQDCEKLLGLMKKVTGEPPRMWGSKMVGFGSYHYRYDSGREGDMFVVGFAPRKQEITLYLQGAIQSNGALLKKLGKHKASGGCLYLKRLSDVDLGVLEKLVGASAAHTRKLWG